MLHSFGVHSLNNSGNSVVRCSDSCLSLGNKNCFKYAGSGHSPLVMSFSLTLRVSPYIGDWIVTTPYFLELQWPLKSERRNGFCSSLYICSSNNASSSSLMKLYIMYKPSTFLFLSMTNFPTLNWSLFVDSSTFPVCLTFLLPTQSSVSSTLHAASVFDNEEA